MVGRLPPHYYNWNLAELVSLTLSVSLPYAAHIRAGRRRPHPRHWQALAQLVGASSCREELLLFIASWFLRRPAPQSPSSPALTLSFIAVALALITGWLGVELVDRLGVGIDNGANLNAPSPLP